MKNSAYYVPFTLQIISGCNTQGGGTVNKITIQYSKKRKDLNNKYVKETIECFQQSPMTDNDSSEFFEPMADYLAQLIIN